MAYTLFLGVLDIRKFILWNEVNHTCLCLCCLLIICSPSSICGYCQWKVCWQSRLTVKYIWCETSLIFFCGFSYLGPQQLLWITQKKMQRWLTVFSTVYWSGSGAIHNGKDWVADSRHVCLVDCIFIDFLLLGAILTSVKPKIHSTAKSTITTKLLRQSGP